MQQVENHPVFSFTITTVIGLVGVMIYLKTDAIIGKDTFDIFNAFAMCIFTMEIIVKIIAQRWHPENYFLDLWNLFDFVVVIFGFVEMMFPELVEGLIVFRLSRLLRVFRLVKSIE